MRLGGPVLGGASSVGTLLLVGMCAAAVAGVTPHPPAGSLYEQEGTPDDGYLAVNAAGLGPGGDSSDNWTNWIYQYGQASWSGIYSEEQGWLMVAESGEMRLRVEADIEVYSSFGAGSSGQESSGQVTGSLTSNTGQYVGISLSDQRPARGEAQGRTSSRTSGRSRAVRLALSADAGPWRPPELYESSAPGAADETAWWLVKRGSAGSFVLQWRLVLGEADAQETARPGATTIVVASVL